MGTLLVHNIHTLVTMDSTRREIKNGALFIRDNIIEQVGTARSLPTTADDILDLQGRHIVLPGLVNTHHHFFSNPHPRSTRRPKQRSFWLAASTVSHLVKPYERSDSRQRPNGRRRADAIGLHHR